MDARDRIEIVEAAYDIGASPDDWQRRLTELVLAEWGGQGGSLMFDASDPGNLVRDSLQYLMTEERRVLHERGLAEGMKVPNISDYVRESFCRGPHLSSLLEVLARLGTTVDTSEYIQRTRDAAPDVALEWFGQALRTLDPSHRGLMVFMEYRPVTPKQRKLWGQLATHIGVGLRLRRTLEALGGDSREQLGEAVVDLDGRCQHAEGDARAAEARELLRHAARSVMRARGSLRKRDPDEALDVWRGLVDGRWSLVDRFDSDGKHYLVAHKNAPEVRDERALSAPEAQVAAYLAMGLANKLIGYTLGMDPAVVSRHVASICRKLGVRSRTELIQLLSAVDRGRANASDPGMVA